MVDFETLDLSRSDKWTTYINKLPENQRDIYFTPEYHRLFEELGDGTATCFVFKMNDDIALYPFLKNSVNQLGFDLDKSYYDIQGVYGYNGVASSCYSINFINSFFKAFEKYCENNNIIAEFTRFHPLLQNFKFSANFMMVIKDRETVQIDLNPGYSEIWQSDFSSKTRNMIRKALKNEFRIQIISNPDEMDINVFMSLYNENMNLVKAEQYYYFNPTFFINSFKYLNRHIYIFNVIDKENDIVSSSLFLHFGNNFHYHLSGKKRFTDNSINNFLIDRATDFAINKGCKKFHLGGGKTTCEDDQLLKFKKSFSKDTVPFYIGKKIHNSDIYNQVVNTWSKLYPEKLEKYKLYFLKYRY